MKKHTEPSFSDRFAYWRASAGLTTQEIAKRLDYSNVAVWQWENGLRVPTMTTFVKICEVLGVSERNFYGNIDGGR